MWLANNSFASSNDDDDDEDENIIIRNEIPSRKPRSTSPPLEGGESLCEFFIDSKNDALVPAKSTLSKDKSEPSQDIKTSQNDTSSGDGVTNKSLFSFFGQGLVPVHNFTQSFLQSILSSVDSQDSVVANAWMETLLDVIDLLPKEITRSEILTLAINKGQLSQPISSRLICCRMLGKLSTKFESYIIKKELLPTVLSLCQDVDFEVRGSMCRQLDVVSKGIGLEATKNAILPQLVELAHDEESYVRICAIETVVHMLPLLDDETCVQIIIPLVQKLCEDALNAEDSTIIIMSKHLGRLCHGLAINFSPEEKLWFLKFFRNLSTLGIPYKEMPDIVPQLDSIDRNQECRYFCAYNMPAMALFTGNEHFAQELLLTFSFLCNDPFQVVRKTMAAGFYEVAKFLDNQSSILLPDLDRLLRDDSLEVLKALSFNLPDILKCVCHSAQCSEDHKSIYAIGLVQALKVCEETISLSTNWRLNAEFLTQMSCLPHCFPPEIVYTHVVPLLFMKLHTARPLPCRMAASYSLLVLLRHTQKFERRNGIINELIRDLCNGRSCHKRMLFTKVCEIVLELFSKAFFKKHFFKSVLQLSADPVPNIRIRLCAILPKLKVLMRLPKDSLLLEELESCVKNLMTDEKDIDVIAAVNKAIEDLDKIEVPTDSISRRTSCIDIELDLEDLRKEEEERRMLELELNHQSEIKKPGIEVKSLNRQGKIPKIPICKSGTLPKTTKSKEFKSNTLTKISSPAKQIPKLEPVKLRTNDSKTPNPMRKSCTMDKFPQYKPNVISYKSHMTNSKSFSKPVESPHIPKKLIDRCPSPMPRKISINKMQDKPLVNRLSNVAEKCHSQRPSPEIFRKSPSLGSRIPTPTSR